MLLMVEGWDEDGRLVRVGNAWVAAILRAEDGRVRIQLMGGGMLVANGSLHDLLTTLRDEYETMH